MFRTLAIVAVAALATGLGALVSTALAAGDKDKADKGFTDLFDGKDMKGWKFFPEGLEKTITVQDGAIVVKGQPNGYFYTDKSYKNYVLRYDWRYKRPANLEDDKKFGGNSGLLVHIQGHKVWPKSLEVQGMNRDHGSFIGIGVKVQDYKFDRAALEEARHKVGEWNTTEVTVKNGEVTSAVNGTPVARGKVDLIEGPFGFQSEGAEIHFKNIKIKPLD
jgi:Domain of Unknown Function (DUF1080)